MGATPFLVRAAVDRTPVRTFSLQMLCDMTRASEYTRGKLLGEGGVDALVELLPGPDPFWSERALQSLGAWLVSTSSSSALTPIELSLLKPHALANVVALFQRAQGEYFESAVQTLAECVAASAAFAEALGRSDAFVCELGARLSYPKADVQLRLLELATAVTRRHADLESLLLDHNLPAVVGDLAKSAKSLKQSGVAGACDKLLQEWRVVLSA